MPFNDGKKRQSLLIEASELIVIEKWHIQLCIANLKPE